MRVKLRWMLLFWLGCLPLVGHSTEEGVTPADHIGETLVNYLGHFGREGDASRQQQVDRIVRQLVEAVENHPEYLATEADRARSKAAEEEAYAGYLPTLYGNSSLGYQREDGTTSNDKKVGLGLNQMLYDFGATASRVDAAESGSGISLATQQAKRNELLHRGIKAWHELYRAMRMAALHRLNVASRKEITDFVAERAEMGGSSHSDVLRARARWAEAEAGVARAEGQVVRARANWLEVVGSPAPNVVELDREIVIEMAGEEAFTQLARNFGAVERAYASHRRASDEAEVAQAERFPKVMLELSTSKAINDDNDHPADRSAQVVVRYDFYTGGAKGARVGQARARAAEAASTAESELRKAEKVLRQAWADVEAGGRTVVARKEAAEVAAQSMVAVREQFAYRRGTLLDLLRVQEDLFYAGRNLIDAITDNALARYHFLYRASALDGQLQRSE